LSRPAKMTGLSGDFRRVAGFVRQEPSHHLRTGLAAKEGAKFKQKVAGMVRSRGDGKTAIAGGATQPSASRRPTTLDACRLCYR
jgi:hypothetical protein